MQKPGRSVSYTTFTGVFDVFYWLVLVAVTFGCIIFLVAFFINSKSRPVKSRILDSTAMVLLSFLNLDTSLAIGGNGKKLLYIVLVGEWKTILMFFCCSHQVAQEDWILHHSNVLHAESQHLPGWFDINPYLWNIWASNQQAGWFAFNWWLPINHLQR